MGVVHGGQVERVARQWGCRVEDILDLSTGVHPEPDPVGLARHLVELAPVIGRYPDREGEPARSALADALGVPIECLWLTAGAQALIEVIFETGICSRLALPEPCYGEVRRCAERSGVRVVAWRESQPVPTDALPWVTQPHSLTGALPELPRVASGVLDESYASFARRLELGLDPRFRSDSDWIRIGSLTKSFSMPGLRLGYVIASEQRIERLRQFLPPWPAPTLALHLLPRLLPSWAERDAEVARSRERLTKLLERAGFRVRPSSASFVLAHPPERRPDLGRHRILVREFPEWPSLAGWVRVGLPPNELAWERLEEALRPC